ncbi:substrate-binding periplasmic protein [Alteromonas facilis]|uniref:substrate-binding periplasmic protein n=1 Tax=Alteromonas facilis TaxID=2048004 RepID=UPI000C295419|nr:transporter substrate-binding domain-containing protein [Alteromonas facilis]
MRQLSFIQFFVGVGVALFSANLLAADISKITVLTSPLPVFSEQQDNGRMTGYSVEFARAVLQQAELDAEFIPLPFARLINQVGTQPNTIATGIGRTAEREDGFYWVTPMTANAIGLFSTKALPFESIAGINEPISVSVLRGDYREELLRQNPLITIVELDSWAQAVGSVLLERVDAVLFSDLGVALTCQNELLQCGALKKVFTHSVSYSYMAVPKTEENRELAIKLTEAAGQFIRSRQFQYLAERWLPQLRLVSEDVSVSEGVIILGRVDNKVGASSPLWVITNLEPLFSVRDERGQLTGYAVELVKNILIEAGLHTEILSAPWQRILVESEMKSDVLVFSLARTAEREELFHWLTPITQNAYSVFSLSEPQEPVNALSDLPAKSRIAVLKGDFREDLIRNAGHIAVTSETWGTVLSNFLSGNAEYLFFSDGGVDVMCDALEARCAGLKKVFTYQLATTYLAISKQGTKDTLIERLKQASDRVKQSPQFAALVEHWLSQYRQQTSLKMHEDGGVIKLWKRVDE